MSEQEQEQQSAATESAPAQQPPSDIVDEEELDVVLERVAPKRSGGCGWFGVLIVLILAAAAVIAYLKWTEIQEEARKAEQARRVSYQSTEAGIKETVKRAADLAAAGNLDAALDVLDAAQVKWEQLGEGAKAQADADIVARALAQKAAIADARKAVEADRAEAEGLAKQIGDLESQIKALQAKRDELNARARDRIMALGNPAAGTGGQQTGAVTGEQTPPATAPQ